LKDKIEKKNPIRRCNFDHEIEITSEKTNKKIWNPIKKNSIRKVLKQWAYST
jgi:hypothetical protein